MHWVAQLAILIGIVYVLGPPVIWLTFRQRVYAKYRPIEVEQLPSRAHAFFASVAPDLAQEGFEFAGHLHQSGSVQGVDAYLALWIDFPRGQLAYAAAVSPAVGATKLMLEFASMASDGQAVLTNNHGSDAGIYDALAWRHIAYLPWLLRPADLYQVHLNRERRLLPADAPRYLPSIDSMPESIADGEMHLLREQVRTGLLRETRTAGEFRPTFVGAWRMVLRLLPPGKQYRLWRARRRARADHADAVAAPAPRPSRPVSVTNQSPYAPRLSQFPLSYA
jgi:hypothetical protein